MNTSRNKLHKTKLEAFAAYCIECGWVREPVKGGVFTYEVLRMRRDGNKDVLLVYDRHNAKEHYTTHGIGDVMLNAFLRRPKA